MNIKYVNHLYSCTLSLPPPSPQDLKNHAYQPTPPPQGARAAYTSGRRATSFALAAGCIASVHGGAARGWTDTRRGITLMLDATQSVCRASHIVSGPAGTRVHVGGPLAVHCLRGARRRRRIRHVRVSGNSRAVIIFTRRVYTCGPPDGALQMARMPASAEQTRSKLSARVC